MWLINTKTMKFEFFHDPSKVKYAILSHTWGDEEVIFQDWQKIESGGENCAILREKLGYSKIEMTCRMASDRKLEYAWVDTCCIDKTSSAELAEAINSMFNWYKCSEICFVYLSDYTGPLPDEGCSQVQPSQLQESDLGDCRWFTRGWTLQELIAPRKIIFFDCNWSQFGTKGGLVEMLSNITKIDIRALTGRQELHKLSVARRLSWAANRETTRIEDRAYCLLGIFDINMYLMYGEGNKAFLRLQEEIIRECKDLSLFAWTLQDEPVLKSRNYGFLEMSGLFASSPTHFSKCSQMKSLAQTQRKRKEFALTHQGFMIDAVFENKRGDDQFCYLDLDTWDGTEGQEGWLYAQLIKNGDIYMRCDPGSLRIQMSRLVWTFPSCEVRPICVQKTCEGFKTPSWRFEKRSSIEITWESSLSDLITRGDWHIKGAEIHQSLEEHYPNWIKVSVMHTMAGNWLAVLPFTFRSDVHEKQMNIAVIVGQNNFPNLRPAGETWVGLFGQPAELSDLARPALTSVADLSHSAGLEMAQVMEGVEDILFSQFSNELGQVVSSRLPMEFIIPDDSSSQTRSCDKLSLKVRNGRKLQINIRREKISSARKADGNSQKRPRSLVSEECPT